MLQRFGVQVTPSVGEPGGVAGGVFDRTPSNQEGCCNWTWNVWRLTVDWFASSHRVSLVCAVVAIHQLAGHQGG